jgi:hypothetical protein
MNGCSDHSRVEHADEPDDRGEDRDRMRGIKT